ncbi:MAG TPA: class I SAM-dependent methyltransferase [Chloroflexota bacterium]|nr:class I SAM-dependent methyltransferase [Chloroflexota bacterium]
MQKLSAMPPGDKRAFYAQPEVVAAYEQQRFGSPSGSWVNERELALIESFLPGGGQVLDLGAGTGRLSQRLLLHGYSVVALDSSFAMLQVTGQGNVPVVQADGFELPFQAGSFDAVAALRVAFHYANLSALLRAVRPALREGGVFVFDTYRWTPRSLFALDAARWGGKVFIHRPEAVEAAAEAAGFRVVGAQSAFLFSPYMYRRLPLPMVHLLARLEEAIPARLRARVFWALEPFSVPPRGAKRGPA